MWQWWHKSKKYNYRDKLKDVEDKLDDFLESVYKQYSTALHMLDYLKRRKEY